MNGKSTLLALTALALVAGCNRGPSNNSAGANASTTTNTAAPAAPAAPAAAAGGAVDQAFLVGHWGRSGDCSRTVSFRADGTASATGEDDARWALAGNALTTTTPGDPPEQVTVSRNGDSLVVSGPQGQQPAMNFTRCPAHAAEAPEGGNPADDAADTK